MHRHLRHLLSVAVMVLVGVLAAPAAGAGAPVDSGSVGIGLLEAPSNRADDPRALVYVIDHLRPGDVIERRFEVANTTASPIDVDLYAAASTISDGGWAPLPGRAANDLTSWTSVSPVGATVAAGGIEVGAIRIAVPADAVPGEHYGVVWAELPVQSGDTVDVVHRVGIRMYLSVGDGTEPTSDFVIRTAHATTHPDGSHTLDVDVDNVGGRAIDINGEVTLTDGPGGTTAGPFLSPTGPTIAPGGSGTLSLAVPADLPDGTWSAQLTLRSGILERHATVAVSWSDPDATGDVVHPTASDDLSAAAGGGSTDQSGDIGAIVASLFALALLVAVAAASVRTFRGQRTAAGQR